MNIKYIILPFLAVLFVSCSSYDKLLKSQDYNLQLAKANEYYDQGRWYRAGELYSKLMPIMRSTKNYEELFYKYSYTLYHVKDYLTASYQFKSFTEAFPQSDKAEDASYMYAYCLYKDSPNYNLDPTNTIKARDALANFVYTHPGSPRITEALTYAQDCLNKLETKNLSSAQLYYNMGQYKAAKIAFLQLINKFPDSKSTDYYQMMAVKSSYFYAKNSDYTRQEERYVEALAVFVQMKDIFPDSKHIDEAEKYNKLSEKNLKILKNGHQ